MTSPCPYPCANKTELGYCLTTGCTNHEYQFSVFNNHSTGEWEELGENKDGTHNIRCNQCGEAFKSRRHANSYYTKCKYRFCPLCGADMRGECIYKRDLDGKAICYIDGYELSEGYCEICDRKVVDGK